MTAGVAADETHHQTADMTAETTADQAADKGTSEPAPPAAPQASTGQSDASDKPLLVAATHGVDESTPRVAIVLRDAGSDAALAERFVQKLRQMFTRYKTVMLLPPDAADSDETTYRLALSFAPGERTGRRLLVEAIDVASGEVFSSRSFDVADEPDALQRLAVRTAAFASPTGGDLARHLMRTAIRKPVEQLTAAECYAHTYDCTSCAGSLDHVSERAVACIDRLLSANPKNVTALALKGAVHAHQYRWGSGVSEPERSELQARSYRARLAIEAATRAEEFSDGTEPAVYWGLVQADQSGCEIDKRRVATQRGLALNPHDPAMLAVFGNWLANAGHGEEGVAMIEQSLAIEPDDYRSWWLMAPGQLAFARGDFQAAYDAFVVSVVRRPSCWDRTDRRACVHTYTWTHDERNESQS